MDSDSANGPTNPGASSGNARRLRRPIECGDSMILDWQRRKGRFINCDPDTIDRRQVIPDPEPPVNHQTHGAGNGGEYHDGPAKNLDA
jgi:hypothetical protein